MFGAVGIAWLKLSVICVLVFISLSMVFAEQKTGEEKNFELGNMLRLYTVRVNT